MALATHRTRVAQVGFGVRVHSEKHGKRVKCTRASGRGGSFPSLGERTASVYWSHGVWMQSCSSSTTLLPLGMAHPGLGCHHLFRNCL